MNYKRLIISLVLPQLAGLVGSFFTVSTISTWYDFLQKPSFNPPSWVFGPAWVLLYFLMGIALYLAWEKRFLFFVHLFFNAIWSIIFFGLQQPGWAFVNIIIIWLFIIFLMIKFWKVNRWSTYLLIPYFLWVSFASVLNFSIWYLN
ncbi:tryptophan-rich sensory protein [Patescibacteria group bacterium]|nr:tryptophan-rich sensory protein [Patescibacteria group bacterium]MBU2633254.1 tryptophan-rich sensory protein [Patescibacteria group bacterium]